jgi:carbonic anhydrase/acetyltransferase-like protein (isoleucine patch superfamily)
MSETSQGQGWWLASDGRWYAPDLPPGPESSEVGFELHDFEDGNGSVPAHRHTYGGGWVAETASVDASAFVGPHASVFERATVTESASVDGSAWVLGDSKVSGHARIRGDSEVSGHAYVTGHALVTGQAFVTEMAIIRDSAVLSNQARIGGESVVDGDARVNGSEDQAGIENSEAAEMGVEPVPPVSSHPQETSGLSIASLVLGILWIGGLGSILALIFGYVAKRDIKRSHGRLSGRGLAIAGIVLGWVGTVSLLLIVGLVTFVAVRGSHEITVEGQPLNLNIYRFTDPARDQSGYSSDSDNEHYAILQLKGTNEGSSSISASLPVSVIAYARNGVVYYPQSEAPNGDLLCASGGESSLSPGESLYYCYAFVLPESETVSRVEASANQQYGSGTMSWSVTDSFSGWSS